MRHAPRAGTPSLPTARRRKTAETGSAPMSRSGPTAGHGVSWPSNGISEVPFRVYTDQEQYSREQERLFQGAAWHYLCLAVELAAVRRLRLDDGRRGRGDRCARRERRDQRLRQPLHPPGQPAVPAAPGQRPEVQLHLSRLDLRPGRQADRRRVRARRQAARAAWRRNSTRRTTRSAACASPCWAASSSALSAMPRPISRPGSART